MKADPRINDVRAYFEQSAERFDRLYSEERQSQLMRWLNRRLRSDIIHRYTSTLEHVAATRPGSVLDAGCGSGRYLAVLAELGVGRLVGIDLSSPMLEMARERLKGIAGERCELVCGDIMAWNTDERFDLVVAMGFFDYQAEPLRALQRMRGFARQSVIASFPGRHWLRMPLRRLRYIFKQCPVYFYRESDIVALGLEAGFARVDVVKLEGATSHRAIFWAS